MITHTVFKPTMLVHTH